MKQKKEKSLISPAKIKSYLEMLAVSGKPYRLKVSNYTTEVESELLNVQFVQTMRSLKCFSAFAKVRQDVKQNKPPVIEKSSLSYFSHNFRNDFFSEEVINIDLKSAYATVLLNDGFISEETYGYLSKIPKLDRLASIGMLAAKKHIFEYNELNELVSYVKQTSELENFFYHAVKRTEEIMNDIQLLSEDKYLFTWVDGIYLRDAGKVDELTNHLTANGYRYTIETLKDFNVEIANKKVVVTFYKGDEEKVFKIPSKPSAFANDLVNLLINKNNKQNENRSDQISARHGYQNIRYFDERRNSNPS